MADKERRFTPTSPADRELTKLYRDRVKDRMKYKSRRQKSLDVNPPSFGQLVTALFRSDNETVKKIEESRALIAWEGFVGESAARVSQPLRIRGTQLIVRVCDPLWMQQLLLLKNELLGKYREAFPGIKLTDIFFTRN